MHAETKPTTKQLFVSWQLIWTRKLSGKPAELKEAITSHVKLFPKGNQEEVRHRTERTVRAYHTDPESIRALIKRGKFTLRIV